MSSSKRIKGLGMPEMIGFVGPFVALICIFTAITMSPWFTWSNNALSDLGNYSNGLIAAVIFNVGLVTTAVLMLYFTVASFRQLRDWPTRLALIILMISLVFLVSIGIFSENFGILHFYVSVGFFSTFPFAMWDIAISWLRFRKLWWFCLVSFLLPFISLYTWTLYFGGTSPWVGDAIPEIVTAITAVGWVWVINLLHYKGLLSSITKS